MKIVAFMPNYEFLSYRRYEVKTRGRTLFLSVEKINFK